MHPHRLLALVSLSFGGLYAAAAPAHAQGLVWNLPEDGTWVRYEGTYTQRDVKAQLIQGAEPVRWDKEIYIKSVGQETAEFQEYDGSKQTVSCRWIEIKSRTGILRDGEIDPGPAGQQIYKVLIPEHKIAAMQIDERGGTVDDRGIPVSHIPIVRGYRQVGENPPEALTTNALQTYPFLALIQQYRTLQRQSNQPEDAGIILEDSAVTAVRYRGEHTMENLVSRSTSEAELWLSDDVPFGLARWSVKVARQAKDKAAPRSQFVNASTFEEEMRVQSTGDGAQSELAVP
ncbi:MAG TPA: hypothetical protein VML55_08655 [Planctomycetaceae bacterium]|nr:hypothetical protein [Planctomycetaceae bacterium]